MKKHTVAIRATIVDLNKEDVDRAFVQAKTIIDKLRIIFGEVNVHGEFKVNDYEDESPMYFSSEEPDV